MSTIGFQNQRNLMKVKSWNFLFRVILWFAIISSGACFWILGTILFKIAGIVLLGMAMAHGVELQHQCIHGNGFKSRSVNTKVGWILGAPMLVAFNSYRKQHLWHHRYLGTPMDKEFFQSSENIQLNTRWKIFRYIFQYKRLKSVTLHLASHQDRNFLLVFLFFILSASFITHSTWFAVGWLVALIFVAEPLHNFIELPEHYACDRSTRKVSHNSRTIRSNWFMTWLTNGNNFHVEHHSHPGVPMQNMTDLHEILRPSICNYHSGYWDFLLTLQENKIEDGRVL